MVTVVGYSLKLSIINKECLHSIRYRATVIMFIAFLKHDEFQLEKISIARQ